MSNKEKLFTSSYDNGYFPLTGVSLFQIGNLNNDESTFPLSATASYLKDNTSFVLSFFPSPNIEHAEAKRLFDELAAQLVSQHVDPKQLNFVAGSTLSMDTPEDCYFLLRTDLL